MNYIYLPEIKYDCYVVYDQDTIRGYHTQPEVDSVINYTDYFINSHYLQKNGSQTFRTTLPECLSNNVLTTDVWYRQDIVDIYILVFIIFFFTILIPGFLIKNVFWK